MKKCKKCGLLLACEDCSKEYDKIDLMINEREKKERSKQK